MTAEPISPRHRPRTDLDSLDAVEEAGFRQLISDRLGIQVQDHQRSDLLHALDRGRRLAQCRTFQAYREILQNSPIGSPEMEALISAITVGESYFFRDEKQLDFLVSSWLPQVLATKREQADKTIRIWSAGCATGEEAYTLAILIKTCLPNRESWGVQILGTDINSSALERAALGQYRPWSLRSLSAFQKACYFLQQGEKYQIAAEFRSLVRFRPFNLASDPVSMLLQDAGPFDLIVCRNVFIYFARSAVARAMGGFAECLASHGSLLLGASDPLDTAPSSLTLYRDEGGLRDDGGFYFRHSGAPRHAAPKLQMFSDVQAFPKVQEVSALPAAEPVQNRQTPNPPVLAKGREPEVSSILTLIDQQRWSSVLSAVESHLAFWGQQAQVLDYRAKALTHLGRHQEAAESCEQSLSLDQTRHQGHLLHGLILVHLGRHDDAEKALRRALFLESGYIEAHLQLGLLLLRNGRHRDGLHSLRNALSLARRQNPDHKSAELTDMTYGELSRSLEADIELYAIGDPTMKRGDK